MQIETGYRHRIAFITAVPMTASAFLVSHLERLKGDYDICLISNFSGGISEHLASLATCIHIPIQRKISPLTDLLALYELCLCMRRYGFDLVQSVTPKAGLLGMLAARFAGVRYRVHWFTGQVWATRRGMARLALKMADRLVAASASGLLTDSHSQREFLIAERVCCSEKLDVIANGSICGVDSDRFKPSLAVRKSLREEHFIPEDAVVCLYLGRLSRDKGMLELAAAAQEVLDRHPNAHLMIVGPDEDNCTNLFATLAARYPGRVHLIGQTTKPEQYMTAADVFCLPSYREGFGSVIIEAAASGLPAVASRIYGVADAIEDGITGILVPVHDKNALAAGLLKLLDNQALRQRMGEAARLRALTLFSRQKVADGLASYYADLFKHD